MPSDREFEGEFDGIDEFGPTSQIRAQIANDKSENLSFGFYVLVQPGTGVIAMIDLLVKDIRRASKHLKAKHLILKELNAY